MTGSVKSRKYLDQLDAQERRCLLTGELLTPQNVVAVLEEPTENPTPDDVRFVSHEVSRLVPGIGFSRLERLCERILRYRKPELFLASGDESSPESA